MLFDLHNAIVSFKQMFQFHSRRVKQFPSSCSGEKSISSEGGMKLFGLDGEQGGQLIEFIQHD